jgi:hypothetical protein
MQTAATPDISAELRQRFATANRVLVFTGAGLSRWWEDSDLERTTV